MATWTSTSSSSSCSVSNLQNSSIFSCFSLPPIFSQICRRQQFTPFAGPPKKHRRYSPENMSVTVPIPPPLPRRYSEDEPFLDSGTRKGDLMTAQVEEDESSPSKTVPHRKKYSLGPVKCFGVDLTPDNIAVAMVYFVQGVLGLSRLAVSFYLKDDLHLDPAETAVISGFSSLPWLIKPLYGFISDSVPLFGYRRRSYLILSGLLGALSWSLMAAFVDGKYAAAFSILTGSLSVAFSDVVSALGHVAILTAIRRYIPTLRLLDMLKEKKI